MDRLILQIYGESKTKGLNQLLFGTMLCWDVDFQHSNPLAILYAIDLHLLLIMSSAQQCVCIIVTVCCWNGIHKKMAHPTDSYPRVSISLVTRELQISWNWHWNIVSHLRCRAPTTINIGPWENNNLHITDLMQPFNLLPAEITLGCKSLSLLFFPAWGW